MSPVSEPVTGAYVISASSQRHLSVISDDGAVCVIVIRSRYTEFVLVRSVCDACDQLFSRLISLGCWDRFSCTCIQHCLALFRGYTRPQCADGGHLAVTSVGTYRVMRSFWPQASIFSLAIEENETLVALRSLRTLRALRPLRAISRWQGMKVTVLRRPPRGAASRGPRQGDATVRPPARQQVPPASAGRVALSRRIGGQSGAASNFSAGAGRAEWRCQAGRAREQRRSDVSTSGTNAGTASH